MQHFILEALDAHKWHKDVNRTEKQKSPKLLKIRESIRSTKLWCPMAFQKLWFPRCSLARPKRSWWRLLCGLRNSAFEYFLERQKGDISIFMSKGFNLTKLEELCRINRLLFRIKTCMVFLPAYYSEMYIDVNSPICCKRKNGLFGKAPKTKSIQLRFFRRRVEWCRNCEQKC